MTPPSAPDVVAQATVPASPSDGQPARSPFLSWPIVAWGLWDWGSASFNAVVTTFVFTTYLASESFGDKASNETSISVGLAVAGACIALLAPVTGQRADRAGRTVFWLGAYTAVVVAVTAAMFLVLPSPGYLWLGIVLLGVGNIFFELASVNYNGLLPHLAPKERLGAVSGLGWGMGYLGGIVLLLVLLTGFIQPEVGWFGVTDDAGLNVRASMLVAAAWFGVCAVPVLLTQSGRGGRRRRQAVRDASDRGGGREHAGMETEPGGQPDGPRPAPRESLPASYKRLWRTLVSLHRSHPEVLWFLLAAAVFRDGLAGVFTYGGIIAQNTFGFDREGVMLFAVVANVVAGAATILAGRLDDVIGPRRVILGSLVVLVVAGLLVFVLHDAGATAFWVLGLVLSACVGPAQSAARSFLARLVPAGREGEIFGLYATTGRAVSFLAPALYGLSVWVGGRVTDGNGAYWGVLGIVTVLVLGLLLMLRVQDPAGHITDLD